VLIDSNVLLERLDPRRARHQIAITSVDHILRTGETAYVTLQNLTEAWRAMTAAPGAPPAGANGFGLTITASAAAFDQIKQLFNLLVEDVVRIAAEWQRLIVRHHAIGRRAYDARLAATMIVHRIDRILTFEPDFARYGVTVEVPA
jgi:predicted nucleic acid-binding protein